MENDPILLNECSVAQEHCEIEDPQQEALARFPEEAFTGVFRSYLDLVEPCTEAPAQYHWVTCLTITGLLLGRNVFVRSPFPLYPNFYSLLIGATGWNRKSTALTFGEREILRKMPNNVLYVTAALSSEGIYQELSKVEGARLLLFCDEMRSFLNVANRQGTSDIVPRLNTLYGCPNVDGLTRRRESITVRNPFVSFIAGTPKEWLTGAIGEGEIMGGFVNRFLLVDGTSDKDIAFPGPPTDEASKRFISLLTEALEPYLNEPREIRWSDNAKAIYEPFYVSWRARQKTYPETTAAITNRIPDHVVKIGMMYSALENRLEITDSAIATAIRVGGYLEQTALAIFGDAGVSSQGRVEKMILTRLENNSASSMGLRELRISIGGKADTRQFNDALSNLERADMIRVIPSLTGKESGQRKTVFLLRK